ncbi:hypothetical protein FB446DRAFT_386030 [Lentinula raphanica]|nr:hypothetical protein FB446DRAFT_386030 [Lentinula raphanica]
MCRLTIPEPHSRHTQLVYASCRHVRPSITSTTLSSNPLSMSTLSRSFMRVADVTSPRCFPFVCVCIVLDPDEPKRVMATPRLVSHDTFLLFFAYLLILVYGRIDAYLRRSESFQVNSHRRHIATTRLRVPALGRVITITIVVTRPQADITFIYNCLIYYYLLKTYISRYILCIRSPDRLFSKVLNDIRLFPHSLVSGSGVSLGVTTTTTILWSSLSV